MSRRCSSARRLAAACLCLAPLVLGACATTLSVDDERRLAYQADREVRQQTVLIQDDVVNAYIDKIGQRIVATLPPNPYEFHFVVIDDPEFNAFTTGAGSIYVHSALIQTSRNVSELAGVMAHEIGHVMSRHVAEGYVRAQNTGTLHQLGAVTAGVLGGPAAYNLAVLGGQLGAVAALNKFTREDESEADTFAVSALVSAGYDPNGLVHSFEAIRARYGDGASFLSDHPATGDRIEATQALIAQQAPDAALQIDDGGQLEIIQRRLRLLSRLKRQQAR